VNKAVKNLLGRLRTLYSLIHTELQGYDMGSSSYNSGAPSNIELLAIFPTVIVLAWFLCSANNS